MDIDFNVSITTRFNETGKKLLDINVNGFISTISEKETKEQTDRAINKEVLNIIKREYGLRGHDVVKILEKNHLVPKVKMGSGRIPNKPKDNKTEQKQPYDKLRYLKKRDKILDQACLRYHNRKQKSLPSCRHCSANY